MLRTIITNQPLSDRITIPALRKKSVGRSSLVAAFPKLRLAVFDHD
jgi:hypothetical protein